MSSAHYQVDWKKPLYLALTLGVVSSGVYWYEYTQKPKQEKQADSDRRALRLKDLPVASIRLVDGIRSFAFRCLDLEQGLCKAGDNSRWELTAPSKLKGDDANVNALISALTNLSPTETLDLSGEPKEKQASILKQTRLEDASIQTPDYRRIEVTLKSGDQRTLYFGESHPIGESLYARSSLDGAAKILIIPTYSKNHFDRDLTYWRDKKIVSFLPSQVKSFTLRGSEGELQAERSEGQWLLRAGKETIPGDIEGVDSLLNAVGYLNAKGFASENKASPDALNRIRGAKKALTLSLTLEKAPAPVASGAPVVRTEEQLEMVLLERKFPAAKKGAAQPSLVFATVSTLDPLYELDSGALPRLDKKLKDLRLSKLLTSNDRFSIRKIRISGGPIGKNALSFLQKEAHWVLESGKAIESKKVSDLLDRLSGNRIQDFVAAAPSSLENAGLTVELLDEKGEARRKLGFWKDAGSLWARDLKSARKEKLKVDRAIEEALPWTATFFDPPAPVAVPSESAKQAGTQK
jgi:hypothetical protein